MKKIILRYGSYAAALELIIFAAIWVIIALFNPSHEIQGYIGWVNVICPLLFVYFGIRYYRDRVNGGIVSFGQALKIGLLMVILPAVAFGIIETIFTVYIQPDFYQKVTAYDIEQYRKTLPPAQFAIKLKQINQQLELDKNPLYNFMMMFVMIGAFGTIVTVISSLLLMRKAKSA